MYPRKACKKHELFMTASSPDSNAEPSGGNEQQRRRAYKACLHCVSTPPPYSSPSSFFPAKVYEVAEILVGVLYSVQGRRSVTLEISMLLDNLLVQDVNERGENVFSRLRLEGVKYRRKLELRAGITTKPLSNHLKVSLNTCYLLHLTQ